MSKDKLLEDLKMQMKRLKSDVKKSRDKAFVMESYQIKDMLKDQIYARKQMLRMVR